MLGEGHIGHILLRLLERCELAALALRHRCPQILVDGFLLDEHPRRWDMAIDFSVFMAANIVFILKTPCGLE